MIFVLLTRPWFENFLKQKFKRLKICQIFLIQIQSISFTTFFLGGGKRNKEEFNTEARLRKLTLKLHIPLTVPGVTAKVSVGCGFPGVWNFIESVVREFFRKLSQSVADWFSRAFDVSLVSSPQIIAWIINEGRTTRGPRRMPLWWPVWRQRFPAPVQRWRNCAPVNLQTTYQRILILPCRWRFGKWDLKLFFCCCSFDKAPAAAFSKRNKHSTQFCSISPWKTISIKGRITRSFCQNRRCTY